MAQGDVTDDDPSLGQVPSGPPGGGPGGSPPGGPPQPGGFLASMARSMTGPQVSAPGAGNQADATLKIQQAIGLLTTALQSLPPGSRLHGDVNKSIGNLSRHLGATSGPGAGVGAQITSMRDQIREAARAAVLHRIMSMNKQQPGQDQQPAGPGLPGAPPMPSTPLPGS